jgi:hypothetical protein
LKGGLDVAGHVNLDRADLGQHRLGPHPVAGVATIAVHRIVFVIAEMLSHLRLQRSLQHPLGELAQQTVRPDQLDAFLPRLADQLLCHALLIE